MGALTSKFTVMAAGRLTMLVLSLASIALITRYLGAEGYGQYRTIVAVMTLAMVVADAGLASIFIREFSSRPEDQPGLLSTAVCLRILLALPLLLGSALLCEIYFGFESFRIGLPIIVTGYLCYSLHTLLFTIFQQRLHQRGAVVAEVAGGILLLGSIFVLTLLSADFVWFVGALGVSYIVTLILTALFLRQLIAFRWRVNCEELKALWRETATIALPATLLVIYMRADSVLLAVLSNLEQVGVYGVSIKLFDAGMGVSLLFIGMVAPLLARYAKDDPAEQTRTLNAALKWTFSAGVAIVVGAWHLGELAILLLAGEPFVADGTPILIVLTIALMLHTLALLCREAIVARNEQSRLTRIYAFTFLIAMAAYVGLIPLYGGLGAALAVLTAELFVVGYLIYTLSSLECTVDLRSNVLPVVLGITMIVATTAIEVAANLNAMVAGLLALAGYVSLLTLLGGMHRDSLTLLRARNEGQPS